KLFSADGSRGFPPVRVGRRQARLKPSSMSWVFCLFKIDKIKQIQTPTAYIAHILISSFEKI
ncbi:hypothetical protein ABE060_09995, partial [Bacillus rugosus]|uniref:hypothetical protein n=1 Tax=Bacillus rugosus TaxID=2715209 RepID=UPI003D25740F